MTISGSGVGGNIGGQQEPSIVEREQTAANQALKLGAGLTIVKDTLTVPFYEVGGQIGRYPANPSRPTLPPLISTRGSVATESNSGGDWKAIASTLVDKLPPGLKAEYLAQMATPFDLRNLDFIVLDNLINAMAASAAWVFAASGLSSTEGVQRISHELNAALPSVMLDGLIGASASVVSHVTNFLDSAGANYIQQDPVRNALRSAQQGLEEFQELKGLLQESQTSLDTNFADLAEKMSLAASQYGRIYTGDDLSIIGYTLNAMALVACTLSVIGTSNPLFYLSLALSSTGLHTTNSETGIFESGLSTVTTAYATGLSSLLLPKGTIAQQKMLHFTADAIVVAAATTAFIFRDLGLGVIPEREHGEAEAAKQRSIELSTIVLMHSGIVDSTISALVETFGLNAVAAQHLTHSLKLMALFTTVLAIAPSTDLNSAVPLTETLHNQFEQNLTPLAEWINEGMLSGDLQSPNAAQMSAALAEARIALDENRTDLLMGALANGLVAAGITNEQFISSLLTLNTWISATYKSLTNGINDQTNTDTKISVAV